ncbi:hypothetical protein [Flavicella sp.]|uniref:hypothetical protein n=1 Tax=Flavicella sp. TaxID=2957742 RepID=UPI0026347139|nr:hypothetical protein [Flavicella sp.]MDG1805925.1 hypothetical protein [Flavicella sp.]
MDSNLKAGFLGGTFFSTVLGIHTEQLIATIVCAAIGAIVSFIVSLLLNILWKKIIQK